MKEREAAATRKGAGEVDVIVLGVGTSGEDISLRLLNAGLDVVGIEASLVGGVCPYWGCLPSKMMLRAANLLQEAQRVNDMAGKARVMPDWQPVAERIRQLTGGWDDSAAVERYTQRGGRLIHGYGRLVGPGAVQVGEETITARRGVVIATGSQPVIPPIPGLDQVDYWTTDDVIKAQELPESLIVLGGGAIGSELGQVLARFGVDVTIVEREQRLLPLEEPEISEVLQNAFVQEGIKVRAGVAAQQVSVRDGSMVVTLESGEEISAERLLVATGRKADLSGLGLESVGLDSKARFIEVDERMRAAQGLWAIGDVTGKGLFTHVALYQAAIVQADILGLDHSPARYYAVPRATFTDPEVGSVGMTEAQARAAGMDPAVAVKELGATFRGMLHGSETGRLKLVVDPDSGVVVGASAAGVQAGEILGLLSLAVHNRVALEDLRSMIYAFPTFHGAVGEAVGAYGRGVTTVLDPEYRGLKTLDSVGVARVDTG